MTREEYLAEAQKIAALHYDMEDEGIRAVYLYEDPRHEEFRFIEVWDRSPEMGFVMIFQFAPGEISALRLPLKVGIVPPREFAQIQSGVHFPSGQKTGAGYRRGSPQRKWQ